MKKLLILISTVFLSFFVYAQSSSVITDILNSEYVTIGQVCYLSAVHQNLVTENATYTECIDILYKEGQIPVVLDESSMVPLANLTYIYSQMWNVKGGIFYSLFNGAPRYSYKQMKSDGVLPDGSDPEKIVTGVEALNIYTACEMKYGAMQLSVE